MYYALKLLTCMMYVICTITIINSTISHTKLRVDQIIDTCILIENYIYMLDLYCCRIVIIPIIIS